MLKRKNIWLSFIFMILLIITLNSNVYALSDKFSFLIDTIGIPRYNIYGEEINEEIYYTYNIFAYSTPNNLFNITSQQRFKNVNGVGKWIKEGGSYKGSGTRGEYYVLGRSYSGVLIYNVYFPVDSIPEVTPDKWNYISSKEAYDSWFNKDLYKYTEQLEYMKNADLLFDEINYSSNTINPYNLVSYRINANKIGLDKVILSSCATWKTNGVVKVNRRDSKGINKYAIFSVLPMAASADILSGIKVDDNVVIPKDSDNVKIPIQFSANAINLNAYADQKHIKEICSVIYIDGKEVARVSGSKTVYVDKYIDYTVSRDQYKSPTFYNIDFKVKSYLYTEFSVDGLLENTVEKVVKLKVEPKEIIPVKKISLNILKKTNNLDWVVSPLVHNIYTNNSNSQGIIEAGRYMAIKLKLNVNNSDIQNLNCYIDNEKIQNNIIACKERIVAIELPVDTDISNTIKSWNYLRDAKNNYFEIDFGEIGQRIVEPHTLKIEYTLSGSSYQNSIKFDSIDSYDKNINYIFDNGVMNKEEVLSEKSIEEWLNE